MIARNGPARPSGESGGAEEESRLDRLRAWLDEANASAACVTNPVSIGYLTGFRSEPHERLFALAVRSGRASLVVPELEREAAQEAAPRLEIRAYADGDDPYAVLAAAIGTGAAVAVEKDHLTLARAEALQARLRETRFLDLGPALRGQRAIKSPGELALMEEAARLTDQAAELALEAVQPGRTEAQIAAHVVERLRHLGAGTAFPPLVQAGPDSALPHAPAGDRRVGEGDLVLLDLGASWRGYAGDITRMAVVGEAGPRQVELHGLVLAAHDAAVAAVRPGVTAGEVDLAAREVIESAGLGEYFIHRTGHGLGLEAHEAPSLEPGSSMALEAGMVVTIEPGVYLPGWGGIRIEDEVVVEPGGARMLTSSPRSLRTVPAT